MTTATTTYAAISNTGFDAAEGHEPLARFIRRDALTDLLMNSRGAKIITIEAKTEPRLLARHPVTGEPNPYKGNVVKVSRVNGMIGWQYEASVNRQRDREGLAPDFEALPRKWGKRLTGTPLVEHEGRYYIELKVERSLDHRYETLDGRALDAKKVEAYLPPRPKTRQGVERDVILRDYLIDNLISIKMGGTVYFLRSAGEVAESSSAASAARMSA